MSAVKITRSYFSGLSHVYNAQPGGLAAILRSSAIALARIKLDAAGAPTSPIIRPAPPLRLRGPGASGDLDRRDVLERLLVPAFNTSMGKTGNAYAVLSSAINNLKLASACRR